MPLTSRVTLNEYVQPIPLPRTGSDLPTGTKCMIAGWGLIDEDRPTSKLFETQVSIYSRRKCSLFYPHLNSGMICAGSFHQLRDSSQGDSGGPLVCNKVAQGIVSFGHDSPPGVYARISNYLPWIRKVMNKHKPLSVILGAQSLQRREGSWQTFQVKEYHSYPGFTSPKEGKDILLLKLNGNASSNGHVRPISLEKSKIRGGTECSLAGWGDRTATVTITRQRDCLNHYPGLADNLICGQSSSSKGDAGDPLVCNNKAFGIFSYKHNNWPGFYTHIAPYLPWVHSVMKSL
ncbi:hypothetical protein EK904_008363 [Melospiza melodia maxima]|nr:hypothetical protein EK904_008363 [Melospiza melodia maxima]